ncbi:MAG: 3-hydroxyanthranilate 3,4-dioxygenase [Gammaproteobacteria bacterium]|nr:3-hydroxyanthranilate 3,4-dioxygenase [Gammaproteobacteria bacterium]
MKSLLAFNFKQWIDDHRHLLKPPVCNQQVFTDNDFIVMIVGGPNVRKDYHYEDGPEFFYQLEGDMLLKTMQDGECVDIPIREGEILMLPPKVPHSPQRFENTVGLVVERKRLPEELDGFMWFCENCNAKIYEEYLYIADIVGQLPPIFERFYDSEENRTCKQCGTVMLPPE